MIDNNVYIFAVRSDAGEYLGRYGGPGLFTRRGRDAQFFCSITDAYVYARKVAQRGMIGAYEIAMFGAVEDRSKWLTP